VTIFEKSDDELLYLKRMQGLSHPQTLGAIVIGFAIVFGTYTLSTFGQPSAQKLIGAPIVITATSSPRAAIAVMDADNNGIEDWRDEFVVADPIILTKTGDDYQPPDTITGKMGIGMIEGIIRSKYQGPAARRTQEQVLTDSVVAATKNVAVEIYDTPNIIIVPNTDEAIYAYANAAARAIIDNNVEGLEWELLIFEDIVVNGNTERVDELEVLAAMYASMRDALLAAPVPQSLVKEHLDVLNTYHAIHKDIAAMLQFETEPTVPLLHLKRYEDDVLGMKIAHENMYKALLPHVALFTENDPAVLFVYFSPNYQLENRRNN